MYVCMYVAKSVAKSAKIAEPRQGQTRLALARSTSQYSEDRWSLPECNFTSAFETSLSQSSQYQFSTRPPSPRTLELILASKPLYQVPLPQSFPLQLRLWFNHVNPSMWNCSLCVSSHTFFGKSSPPSQCRCMQQKVLPAPHQTWLSEEKLTHQNQMQNNYHIHFHPFPPYHGDQFHWFPSSCFMFRSGSRNHCLAEK